MYNENILIKLLKIFEFDIETIKKYISYFDIFEQNIMGENIYSIIKPKYKNELYGNSNIFKFFLLQTKYHPLHIT